jgi:hypothetical protein
MPTRAPGTFKDRVLLSTFPDLVFEGMTVAAYAVGATKGFVYLRGEYRYLLDRLNAVLARRRRESCWARTSSAFRGGFRHRDSCRCGRLCLRRGVSADRVARRQARHAAQPAAFPRDQRLSRSAHHRQ